MMVSGVRCDAPANKSSGTAVMTPVNNTSTSDNVFAVVGTLPAPDHV